MLGNNLGIALVAGMTRTRGLLRKVYPAIDAGYGG